MTLNDYLKEKQLSDTAFAKEIGVPYAIMYHDIGKVK